MQTVAAQELTMQINGIEISKASLEGKKSDIINMFLDSKQKHFVEDIIAFLEEWFSSSPTIAVHTSGSTGTPKSIEVRKKDMINSANNSCDFFNLCRADRCLICLPMGFIAGKMMVVRALVRSLNLIVGLPSLLPFVRLDNHIKFMAITPMQLENILINDATKRDLSKVKQILLGGSGVSSLLKEKIKHLSPHIYSSYGMTETLSHIAIQRLNGAMVQNHYTTLPQYSISQSATSTLNIHLPWQKEEVCTNDIVEMISPTEFRYIGRLDNIINSGGIKISPERVENILAPLIDTSFAISSVKDEILGEKIVLISDKHIDLADITKQAKKTIESKWLPKAFIKIPYMPYTKNGKIDRYRLKKFCQIKNILIRNEYT